MVFNMIQCQMTQLRQNQDFILQIEYKQLGDLIITDQYVDLSER